MPDENDEAPDWPDYEEWDDDEWTINCPYCEGEGCKECDWTGEY